MPPLQAGTGARGEREDRVDEQQHLVRAGPGGGRGLGLGHRHNVITIRTLMTATATAATATTPADQASRSSAT